jgi:hypothetical protein
MRPARAEPIAHPNKHRARLLLQWPVIGFAEESVTHATLHPMRVLDHIRQLSDEGGQGWLLDVHCPLRPLGLGSARAVGWDTPLHALQPRLRCTACGAKGLTIAAISAPRARGVPKNPH